jgi:hypothetical protein
MAIYPGRSCGSSKHQRSASHLVGRRDAFCATPRRCLGYHRLSIVRAIIDTLTRPSIASGLWMAVLKCRGMRRVQDQRSEARGATASALPHPITARRRPPRASRDPRGNGGRPSRAGATRPRAARRAPPHARLRHRRRARAGLRGRNRSAHPHRPTLAVRHRYPHPPRGHRPATGTRYLEELAFEIVNEQSLGDITKRAGYLSARGVRRIIAIIVKLGEVRE